MTSHLNKKWFDIDLQHLLKILSQPGTLYLPKNTKNTNRYFTLFTHFTENYLYMKTPERWRALPQCVCGLTSQSVCVWSDVTVCV